MKKLLFLMSIGMILFTSCSKVDSDDQITEATADLVWVYSLDGTLISKETAPVSTPMILKRNGNSVHAHGDFTSIEFSGTENDGGTFGSATASVGPWTFTFETECLMVDGNEAVYGGTITERVGPPAPPSAPFNIGDHAYWKVIDNGQGSNADPDQFLGTFKFSTASQCGVYTPDNTDVWPSSKIYNVPEPGSIKVNS